MRKPFIADRLDMQGLLAWSASIGCLTLLGTIGWWVYDYFAGFQAWVSYNYDAHTFLEPVFQAFSHQEPDFNIRGFLYPLTLYWQFSLGLEAGSVVRLQVFMVMVCAGLVSWCLGVCLRGSPRWILGTTLFFAIAAWPHLGVFAHFIAHEATYALSLCMLSAYAFWLVLGLRRKPSMALTISLILILVLVSFIPLWINAQWYLGALFFSILLGSVLIIRQDRTRKTQASLFALLTALIVVAFLLPAHFENWERKSQFGIKTIFCNHYPIIERSWTQEERFSQWLTAQQLKELNRELAWGLKPAHTKRKFWAKLGYMADSCVYSSRYLDQVLDKQQQLAFMKANIRILLTSELPAYVGKILKQQYFALTRPAAHQSTVSNKGRLYERSKDMLARYGSIPSNLGFAYKGGYHPIRPPGSSLAKIPFIEDLIGLAFIASLARILILAATSAASRSAGYHRLLLALGTVLTCVFLAHISLIAAAHTFDISRYLAPVQPMVFGIVFIGIALLLDDLRRLFALIGVKSVCNIRLCTAPLRSENLADSGRTGS